MRPEDEVEEGAGPMSFGAFVGGRTKGGAGFHCARKRHGVLNSNSAMGTQFAGAIVVVRTSVL